MSTSQLVPNPEQPKGEFDRIALLCVRAGLPMHDFRRALEQSYVRAQLAAVKWNQCRAAKALGIHRNTLSRIVAQLDVTGDIRAVRAERRRLRRARRNENS